MMRVEINPDLLKWAVERVGERRAYLYDKFPKLEDWERGGGQPTLKQLEDFARTAYVPIGYLFLPEPPEEKLPIPDLRTVGGKRDRRPSPDLLDMIYLCQRRQAWYQDHAESIGEDPKTFVGTARLSNEAVRVASEMRQQLGFSIAERRAFSTWEEALRRFVEQTEELGILVMVSGVVGSNNKRTLNPDEFRGFALADTIAPLIFINGADAKAAQMFTLAHELAHIWLGQSAVGDSGPSATHSVEVWCNRVAAELLVPLVDLKSELGERNPVEDVARLARVFKVSTLVILRRLLDAGAISRDKFDKAYSAEMAKLTSKHKAGGGNFYLTQGAAPEQTIRQGHHHQYARGTDALSRRLSDARHQQRANLPGTRPALEVTP